MHQSQAAFSSGRQLRWLNRGDGLLYLLGDGSPKPLVEEVARKTGRPSKQVEAFLSWAALISFGVLGAARRDHQLDTEGLAKLIQDEEDSGRATSTHSTPTSEHAIQPAPTDMSNSSQTPPSPVDANRGTLWKTVLPLVLLGIIAFLGYQTVAHRPARPNLPAIKIPGFDTAQFYDRIKAVTNAVGKIHDEASATEALSVIQESQAFFDQYDFGAIRASSEGEAASRFILDLAEPLRTKVESANAIPGVGEILTPAIGPFLDSLSQLD